MVIGGGLIDEDFDDAEVGVEVEASVGGGGERLPPRIGGFLRVGVGEGCVGRGEGFGGTEGGQERREIGLGGEIEAKPDDAGDGVLSGELNLSSSGRKR